MSRGLFQPLSNEGMNATAGLSLCIQAPATPAWSQHKTWMAMHKSPTTPERDGANKGAPSPNGSIQAGERQMPPAKTMYCWKSCTTALSGFWFCSKEDGSGTHMVKTTRITTKASDHQKNSSVEDSRDERTRWQSSSLTVLIVLKNRQFRTPSSFGERLQILKTLTVCYPYSPAERSLER